MAKDVCCDVHSCVYNANEKCEANEIKVCTCHCQDAHSNKETECHTFKMK